MPCDPNTLLESAKCFACLTEEQRALITLYLLCQLADEEVVDPNVLFIERFEANPGYDLTGWTESGSDLDPNYTGVVLQGLQSFRVTNPTLAQPYILRTLAPIANPFFYFQFELLAIATPQFTAFLFLTSAADGFLGVFGIDTTAMQFWVQVGAGFAQTVGTFALGVKYHVWIEYNKNNGVNRLGSIAFSTDGIRPVAGNNYAEALAAVHADDVGMLRFGITPGSDLTDVDDHVLDYLIASSAQIGDNP